MCLVDKNLGLVMLDRDAHEQRAYQDHLSDESKHQKMLCDEVKELKGILLRKFKHSKTLLDEEDACFSRALQRKNILFHSSTC